MNEPKKLTGAQYWEWRTIIAEMEIEQEKARGAELQDKVLQREAEIASAKVNLFRLSGKEAIRKKVEEAKLEYEKFKKSLEEIHGVSLNNKVIDDVTFEIRDLPKDTK